MRGQSNTMTVRSKARLGRGSAKSSLCLGYWLWAGSAFAQGASGPASDANGGAVQIAASSERHEATTTTAEPTGDVAATGTAVEPPPSVGPLPQPTSNEEPPAESEPVQPNDAAIESKPETRPLPPSKAVSAKPSANASTAGPQPMFGTFEGTYGSSGLASGFSFGPSGGLYIGGEVSVVRQFQEFTWLGGYVDGVYDFGREQTRFSIGPEFGWSALGIDGGYLLAVDVAGVHHGVTARPLLTMGFVSAYGRMTHLFGVNSTWLEAGLLLKYPVEF